MNLEERFRVPPKGFDLDACDPGDKAGLKKGDAEKLRETDLARLAELQERLYAEGRRSLLVVLQAMDAAGKDGTIEHVMSGLNPQGVTVTSFKQPSSVELAHDFLWRTQLALPARGGTGCSTARTTRRCSSCACTRSTSAGRASTPSAVAARACGGSASRTSARGSATSSATGPAW